MRENHFYIGVRTRNNVYGNEFTNALCCSSTGIGSRFDSADVATYHNRYEAAANEDFTNEVNVCSFYHSIGCFNRTYKTFCFD